MDVMVLIIGNGDSKSSLNPLHSLLHFTLHNCKDTDPIILSAAQG